MSIRKTTLAILWPIIFVGSVALAAAGDRYFSNPTLNKDVVIQVNRAGVTTDALKVTGSTGAVNVGGAFTGASTLTLTAGSLNIGTGESLVIKNASGVARQVVTIDGSNNTSLGGTVDGGIKFYGGTGNERGSMTSAGVWTLGPPTSSLKIGDSGKSGVALIGNRDANSFTIANSSSATFSVSGLTASVPAIVLIHNGLTGHAAIFLVSLSNISVLVAQTGAEFTNSASPGAAQVGVTYANAQANVTVTTGSSQGGTFYVTVIGTNL